MKLKRAAQTLFVLSLAGLQVYSCSPVNHTPPEPTKIDGLILPDGTVFTRASLLESVGTCILSEVERFEKQSQTFASTASIAIDDPAQRTLAQQAWKKTFDIWQQLEVMQIGPARKRTDPGGQDLRDSIYAWPWGDSCAVDSYLVSELYASDPANVSAEANGLGALEYLLFYDEKDNACSPEHEINTSGAWNEVTESTLRSRRARYAAFAAKTVAESATSLLTAWSPNGDNFLAELSTAGEGSRTYGKKRIALNVVSDALGYIEWAVKDRKLAKPLGLNDCDQELCPDLLESKYSRNSKENLKNNIIGFQKIFEGCGTNNQGLGFDDFLVAIRQADLAEAVNQAAQVAIAAVDSIEEPNLVSALNEDPESVLAVHRAISTLSNLIRSDVLLVLNLELPRMVQGDND